MAGQRNRLTGKTMTLRLSLLSIRLRRGKSSGRQGVAVLSRDAIDTVNRLVTVAGVLAYERDCCPDNPYHGNILLREGVAPLKMKMIAADLALRVSAIIPQRRN